MADAPRRTPEEWAGALALTSVLAMLGVQVVLRYGFGRTLSWLEEVSRFAFVWAVYFGFVVAAEKQRHIRVAMHLELLPDLWRKAAMTLADLIWLAFNAVVVWHGAAFVASMFEFPYISQTTGINLAWVQMIVPAGFAFLSVRVAQGMVRRWRGTEALHDLRRADEPG